MNYSSQKTFGYFILGLGLLSLLIFGGFKPLLWSVSYTTYKFDTPTGWLSAGEYAVKDDKYLVLAENLPPVLDGEYLYNPEFLEMTLDKKYITNIKSGLKKDSKDIIYKIEADYDNERGLVIEVPQTFNVSNLKQVEYLGQTAYHEFLDYSKITPIEVLVEDDDQIIYLTTAKARIVREEDTLNNYEKLQTSEINRPSKIVRTNIFAPSRGEAAIAHEVTTSSGIQSSVNSITFAHNHPTVSDSILMICTGTADGTDDDRIITSASYNGDPLTFINIGREVAAANHDVEQWYLLNADTGANNVTVNYTGSVTSANVFATSYSGVDQTTPIDNHRSDGIQNVTSWNIALTSTTTDAYISDCKAMNSAGANPATFGVDSPATERGNENTTTFNSGLANIQATTTSTNIAWTCAGGLCSTRDWANVTVALTTSSGSEGGGGGSELGQWLLKGILSLKGGFGLGGNNYISSQTLSENEDVGAFGLVQDYETEDVGEYKTGYLWYFQWGTNPGNPEGRASSTLDIVDEGGNKFLRIGVNDDIFDASTHYNAPGSSANLNSVLSVTDIIEGNNRALSPRSDILRVKIRINQGTIGVTVGAPVSQLGNSDVLTDVKYLSPGDTDDCVPLGGDWVQCDFDLNENLIRNTRRANYSGSNNNPVSNSLGEEIIHYTRWMQESLALNIVTYDSFDNKIINGNPILDVDDFELVNEGKGKYLSKFLNINHIETINNFELEGISNSYTINFNWPTTPNPPAILSSSMEANTGNNSLKIESQTAEELSWVGFSAPDAEGANAISFEMKLEYEDDSIDNHVIDFIALANPTGVSFDWSGLSAGAGDFDYELSELSTAALDFSVYHARRIIPRDRWVKVTIPFADFAAAYGSGSMVTNHEEQIPLEDDKISFVGLQTGWIQKDAVTTIYIDSIKYVSVVGEDEDLRSYYQGQVYTP